MPPSVDREEVTAMTETDVTERPTLRDQAIRRLKKRRDFGMHLLAYALVNGFLVVIWAMTDSNGFFWPIFPMAGWGIGVVLNAWDVYRREDFTEEQIRAEERHLQGQR
jgi:2TM domain-containing protein